MLQPDFQCGGQYAFATADWALGAEGVLFGNDGDWDSRFFLLPAAQGIQIKSISKVFGDTLRRGEIADWKLDKSRRDLKSVILDSNKAD